MFESAGRPPATTHARTPSPYLHKSRGAPTTFLPPQQVAILTHLWACQRRISGYNTGMHFVKPPTGGPQQGRDNRILKWRPFRKCNAPNTPIFFSARPATNSTSYSSLSTTARSPTTSKVSREIPDDQPVDNARHDPRSASTTSIAVNVRGGAHTTGLTVHVHEEVGENW